MTHHASIDWKRQWPSSTTPEDGWPGMDFADLAIGAANRVRLRCIANDVSTEEAREFRRLLPAASARARFVADHWDSTAPARAIDDVLFDTYAFPSAVDPA